jgi:hypothetical protein
MAYWFGRFSLFCFVLLNSSAEVCAGSLAPGCRILGIFANSSQVSGAQACHLACLVPLLWRSGGPWDDPWTLRSTRKDTVRSRLGFYRFLIDLGHPFKDVVGNMLVPCLLMAWFLCIFFYFGDPFCVLLGTFGSKRIFFHIYFQVAFSNDFWV